jgi:hypothetical protein
MLVTDQFIYLHMPKTGGNWVQPLVQEALGGRVTPEAHCWAREEPADLWEGRHVFATIRNPWDWYLSWYQMHVASKWWRNRFMAVIGDPDNLETQLYGLTHPDPTKRLETKLLPFDPEEFGAGSVGLYSYLFRTVLCDSEDRLLAHSLLDLPSVREGLLEVTGLDRRDEEAYPPKNTKHNRPHTVIPDPKAVWTPERIQWVREADAEILALLGYDGPSSRARKPVITDLHHVQVLPG